MTEDSAIGKLIKGGMRELVGAEDLIFDSFRDIMKEEVKRRIRDQLEADPDLRAELRDAIAMYFEAKVQEAYASLKLAKAGAKLGLEMLPETLRKDLSAEVMSTVEKELSKILARTI